MNNLISKQKSEGQVFTPPEIVKLILDTVDYKGTKILTQTVIEPSFGEGAFLTEIVLRIIKAGIHSNIPCHEISSILNNNVYGIEKDDVLYKKAITSLNDLLNKYHIPIPEWKHLLCGDTLLLYKQFEGKMSYCIGNPPYVRIHNINDNYTDLVKSFSFTGGTTDLYIVFYEIGLKLLNDNGKLIYITPNSFMRNSSQKDFRAYLIDNHLLTALYDFKSSQLFSATTYSCICLLSKACALFVDYKEFDMLTPKITNTIDYSFLESQTKGFSWNFGAKEDMDLFRNNLTCCKKLNDIAVIQNAITTNRDKVYIGKAYMDKDCTIPYLGKHTDSNQMVWFNGHEIESAILHRCIKASKCHVGITNLYILFPYHPRTNNQQPEFNYIPYEEQELMTCFPKAYQYLLSYKETLLERDMDVAQKYWYVFGRSQGLKNSGLKKIVFKHIISTESNTIKTYWLDEDVVVYTGIYISAPVNFTADNIFDGSKYEHDLKHIQKILEQPEFSSYCKLVGQPKQGNYIAITSPMVKNFGLRCD